MQRIDENTYIDDTVVTCAEYQLFIDEMREQGEYYQPDHWTSYQFPDGQARRPILGVRRSDAENFCEWLTSREVSDWEYRLPSREEADNFTVKSHYENPLGYWLIGDIQFAWVGDVPNDAREIDFQIDFASTFTRSRARASERTKDREYNFDLELEIENACVRALDRPLHLTIPFFNRHREFDNTRDFDHFLADTLDQALELAILQLRIRDSARSVARIRSISRSLRLDHILGLDLMIPEVNLDTDFNRALNHVRLLDLYCDTYTLKQRIAGRSSAFEGIRLVKERIK